MDRDAQNQVFDAYVALGSNIQNPKLQIQTAFSELNHMPRTRLIVASSLYRSAPWGYADQPDFLNAVAQVRTELSPRTLLTELLKIEQKHGREREFLNAPRTLDLDIVLYGDLQIDEPGLTIPHPRMHERAFVLIPLIEIAPDLIVPGRCPLRQLAAACDDTSITRLPN